MSTFLIALAGAAALVLEVFVPAPFNARFTKWSRGVQMRLDRIKPDEFVSRWLRTSRRAQLGAVLFTIISFVVIFGPPTCLAITVSREGFDWSGVGLILLALFAQGLAWNQASKVFETLGRAAFRRLDQTRTVGEFTRTSLWFLTLGAVAIGALGFPAYALAHRFTEGSFWFRTVQFVMYLYWGLVATWVVMLLDGVITLLIAMPVLISQLIVNITQWFTHCVCAYSRGPLAALGIVFVAMLGLIKALMNW